MDLRRFAEEQAALRRVARLAARAAPPEEVLAAVTAEAGRVLGADVAGMCRYKPDGAVAAVGVWSSTGAAATIPVGTRWSLSGRNVTTLVFQTHQPARIVATADATRRRIERDLHDGAQQRLVSLGLRLRAVQAAVPPGAGELKAQLDGVAAELGGVLDELHA